MNEFGDLLHHEFVATLNGYRQVNKTVERPQGARYLMPAHTAQLPKNVDWREKGAVTPVKNQGQCGSCWAFGTTEQIEAYTAIASGNLVELSAQQVPKHPWKSQLFSRLHPVPQTPSTVVAMEVARVHPLPLLTATSNFLDRFYLSPFPV